MWRFRRSTPFARRLSPEDAEACAHLHGGAFAYPWSSADFEHLLLDGSVRAWGFEAPARRLAAFALARIALDEAEILTIATAPAWRRRGLGFELMTTLHADLARQAVQAVFLEVDERNAAALGLYARLGFERVGERKAYYRLPNGAASAALVLRARL
jgi:ribosomal-protein-alanine N-acetyltransferase